MTEIFKNYCRVCATQCTDTISIFKLIHDEKRPIDLIEYCLQQPIDTSTRFPENICTGCTSALIETYNFFVKYKESEEYFLVIHQQVSSIQPKIEVVYTYDSEDVPENAIKTEAFVETHIDNIHVDDVTVDELMSDYNTKNESEKQIPITSKKSNKKVTKKPEFFCKTCNKAFARKCNFTMHQRIHLDARPHPRKISDATAQKGSNGKHQDFECYICKEPMQSLGKVRLHLTKLHRIYERYELCLICRVSYIQSDPHMCQPEVETIECEYCSQRFQSVPTLLQHLEVAHTKKKIYRCTICPRYLPMQLLLDYHQILHRKQTEKEFHYCDLCPKKFSRPKYLKMHIAKVHDANQRKHLCDECGRSFFSAQELRTHKVRHAERTIQCPDCPLRFHTNPSFRLHQETHQNKKYICDLCNAELSSKSVFKKHARRHKLTDEDKRFKCTLCPSKFFENNRLMKHLEIVHSSMKQFQCTHCDAAYKHKGDLTKHLRTHLGDEMYRCSECPKQFRTPLELQKHSNEHYRERNAKKDKEEI